MSLPIFLAIGAAGALLVFILLILHAGRLRRRKTAAFQAICASLGLRRAPLEGRLLRSIADHSWLGVMKDVPVIVQFCEGVRGRPVIQGIAGIEIALETGVDAGGAWHLEERAGRVDFVDRPIAPSTLAERQRTRLGELYRGGRFRLVAGIPFESVLKGSRLDLIVRSGWPDGWRGLVLRGVVPLQASADEIAQAFDDLRDIRRVLRNE